MGDGDIQNRKKRVTDMLLALLKAALGGTGAEEGVFRGIHADEWVVCHQLAVEQGVMALAWDGALTLPQDLQPPRTLKIKWALEVEALEKRYARYCRTVEKLDRFYRERGIAMVQLKGVGFSVNYPQPSHREGGDIDIYTYSADTERMDDREANALADRLISERGVEVDMDHGKKHSVFYIDGIPVENHRYFLNKGHYDRAEELDALLHRLLEPVRITLPGGERGVSVPSGAFNVLFILLHAAQHYGSGIALHHLVDWAVILQRYGWALPEELADRKILRFARALTALCEDRLGIRVPRYGRKHDMEFEEEILQEMLFPEYRNKVPVKGVLNVFRYKYCRFMNRHRLYKEVLDCSLCSAFWASFMEHIKHPEKIFTTGEK